MWCAPQSPIRPLPYHVPGAEPQARRLEGTLRRVELPEIPVEACRHGLLRLFRARVAPGLHDRHMHDRPERAGVDDFFCFREVIPAALLRADLNDLRALLIGVEHGIDAGNAVRRRLLAVDVLPGGDGVDGDRAVGMIGRRDQDGVNVLAIQDAAVIDDGLELERLALGRHPRIQLRLVHLDGRDELAVRPADADHGVEHATGPSAAADHRHADPVVRALPALERVGRRRRKRGGGGLQERTPRGHGIPFLDRRESTLDSPDGSI